MLLAASCRQTGAAGPEAGPPGAPAHGRSDATAPVHGKLEPAQPVAPREDAGGGSAPGPAAATRPASVDPHQALAAASTPQVFEMVRNGDLQTVAAAPR